MASSHPSSPFLLERMVLTDFSSILRPSNRRAGDLCIPPVAPLCWPCASDIDSDPEASLRDPEALIRLEYTMNISRAFFERDPTCHFIKAVTAEGEIVSIVRWHFYPHGYTIEANEPVDLGEFVLEGATVSEGGVYNLELWRTMRVGMMRMRQSWMDKGPSWGTSASLRSCRTSSC